MNKKQDMDLIQKTLSRRNNLNFSLLCTWIASSYILWFRFETILGYFSIMILLYLSTFFMYLIGMANGIKMSKIQDKDGFIKMTKQMKHRWEKDIKDNPNYVKNKIKKELKEAEDQVSDDIMKDLKQPKAKA